MYKKYRDEPFTSKKSRNADDFSKRASLANVGPNGGTFLDRETAMLKHKNGLFKTSHKKTINPRKFLHHNKIKTPYTDQCKHFRLLVKAHYSNLTKKSKSFTSKLFC